MLSGLGGETATGGGVPTPRPELQSLLKGALLYARSSTERLGRQDEEDTGCFCFGKPCEDSSLASPETASKTCVRLRGSVPVSYAGIASLFAVIHTG